MVDLALVRSLEPLRSSVVSDHWSWDFKNKHSKEVTPYAPLLIEGREVEVIISIDGVSFIFQSIPIYEYPLSKLSCPSAPSFLALQQTGDSSNFANGSSIVKTAQRAAHYADIYKFPQVPLNVTDYTTFELVKRPTFFGCEESEAPLLVWIANSAPIDGSRSVLNTSTLQLSVECLRITFLNDQAS